MLTGHRTLLYLILLLFTCSLAGIPALAASAPAGGDDSAITVVMDNNYPPFSFRDVNGNLVGISVDMWRLWEKQTGKSVQITGLEWDDAIHRMEAGEFDVIDTVFYSEERAEIYDFTPPYADVDVVIFFNADISGISGLESLDGFVVGMNRGDSSVGDVIKKGISVREYPNYEAVVTAAKDGEIVVFVLDKPGGVYYLHRLWIQDRFKYSAPVIRGQLHRAVMKGDTTLLTEVNNGFAGIAKSEYAALDRKWYGTPVVNPDYLRFVVIFACAGILLIILLAVMNHALKRKVAQKTVELNAELDQHRRADEALNRATRKLGFLNAITFNDIQNALFSLTGFLELEKELPADEKTQEYRQKQGQIIHTIAAALRFAKNYQDLGMNPPAWQDVSRTFLIGISHIDLSNLDRKIPRDHLEIYADPLLERVFLTLAENVLLHGMTATEISLHYRRTPEGLVLVFRDNGVGIPAAMKERVFERRFEGKKGVGLYLAREILSITGITITETGTEGTGARFEMLVPEGAYRFPDKS
jgi:ABC-type amino acid transport substrate-binding protein